MKLSEIIPSVLGLILTLTPRYVSSQARVGALPGVVYADQAQASKPAIGSFSTLNYGSNSHNMVPGAMRQISRTIEYRDIPPKPAQNPGKVIEIGPSTNAIRLHFTSASGPVAFENVGPMSSPSLTMRSSTNRVEPPRFMPQASKPIAKPPTPLPLNQKPLPKITPNNNPPQVIKNPKRESWSEFQNEFTESMPIQLNNRLVHAPAPSSPSLLQPTQPNYLDRQENHLGGSNLIQVPVSGVQYQQGLSQENAEEPVTYMVPPYQSRPIIIRLIDLAMLNQMLDQSVQLGSNYHLVPVQFGYPQGNQDLLYKKRDNLDEKLQHKLKTPYEQIEAKKPKAFNAEATTTDNGKDFMEVVVEQNKKNPVDLQ